ncbi:MAG: arginine--tRNA ligase [bacterium]
MITKELRQSIAEALMEEELFVDETIAPEDIPLETPRTRSHGHYSSSVAFAFSGKSGRPTMELAESIVSHLKNTPVVEAVEVAPPGFINFRIKPQVLRQYLLEALKGGESYGCTDGGADNKVQVEFVSANPTGPLSVGHGRIAAFGDSLANLLGACGYDVQREYYVNDVGTQITNLGRSLDARYREALGQKVTIEEGGYRGRILLTMQRRFWQRTEISYLRLRKRIELHD